MAGGVGVISDVFCRATVRMRGRLRLPKAARGREVDVTDRLHRDADEGMVDRAEVLRVSERRESIRLAGQ